MRDLILGVGGFILAATAWELAAALELYPVAGLPPPTRFLPALNGMITDGTLLRDLRASFSRYGTGLAIGVAAGVALGLMTGRSRTTAAVISPLLHYLRAIPSIALIPVGIAWFGIGDAQKVFIVAWGCTFPVWLGTLTGILQVDRRYVWTAATLGASAARLNFDVYLPSSVPYIIAAIRISIATGFFALAAAEMVGAFEGIGYRITSAYQFFQTGRMMIAILAIGVLSLCIDLSFVMVVRRLFPWLSLDTR